MKIIRFSAAEVATKQRIEIERQNAEISKLKERLSLSQSNHETDRRRLEDETRAADRLKEANCVNYHADYHTSPPVHTQSYQYAHIIIIL